MARALLDNTELAWEDSSDDGVVLAGRLVVVDKVNVVVVVDKLVVVEVVDVEVEVLVEVKFLSSDRFDMVQLL